MKILKYVVLFLAGLLVAGIAIGYFMVDGLTEFLQGWFK